MTADILPFFRGRSFDAELTSIMGEAYDKVLKMLRDLGQPAVVNEVIARQIIEIAQTGERDPDKICERTLAALGIARDKWDA